MPQPQPSSTSPGTSASLPPELRPVLGGLWVSNLFSPLLIASVIALLPSIGREIGATTLELSLILISYMLAQVVFNILGGRMGDLWGLRRMLLTGLVVFTAATAGIGFAPDTPVLLMLRVVQGGAAAAMSACTTAIGLSLTPPSQRGRVMGLLTSAVYLGLTLGPLIGGGIATLAGWRAFFLLIALPGAGLWFLLRSRLKQEWRNAKGETMDVPGALLLTIGLSLLVIGVSMGSVAAWIPWLIAPGVAVLALFIMWERRAASPLVDLRLFSEAPGFAQGLLALLINYGAFMGAGFLFSIYLQQVRDFSPFDAGLILMLQSLFQVLTSPLGGRLADRFGAERVSAVGMLLCSLGIGLASRLGADSPLALMFCAQIVLGTGIGFFSAPNMVATLRNVPLKRMAVGSGLAGSMRTLGGLCSNVIVALVIGLHMGDAAVTHETTGDFLAAMRTALVVFALLNLVGLGVGLFRAKGAAR